MSHWLFVGTQWQLNQTNMGELNGEYPRSEIDMDDGVNTNLTASTLHSQEVLVRFAIDKVRLMCGRTHQHQMKLVKNRSDRNTPTAE